MTKMMISICTFSFLALACSSALLSWEKNSVLSAVLCTLASPASTSRTDRLRFSTHSHLQKSNKYQLLGPQHGANSKTHPIMLPALSVVSTLISTSLCKTRSLVNWRASSPKGSPSILPWPPTAGRAPRGQLIPADKIYVINVDIRSRNIYSYRSWRMH